MSKKKALVVFYTQSGQLKNIVDSICKPMQADFDFTYEELKPEPAFPFPWKGMEFYQAFPESVQEIPCKLQEFNFDPEEDFDLVILAYQPWYLSASIPFTSFLMTEDGQKVMKGKPVITIIGSRNMWIMAHERVKKRIMNAGGNPVGNIVLVDKSHNLVSVVTIVRWMMKGEKHGGGLYGKLFPPAGVRDQDIQEAAKYGPLISRAFQKNELEELQDQLIAAGAVQIKPVLMAVEKRGYMMFKPWSKFVLRKGGVNDPARAGRLKMFRAYLFTVIYLVSPIGGAVVWLIQKIFYKSTSRAVKRYARAK